VILVAFLLVLAGLGLFVAGVLTGVTALYWACVAACVVAAVVIFLARRGLAETPTLSAPAAAREPVSASGSAATAGAAPSGATPPGVTESGAAAGGSTAAGVPAQSAAPAQLPAQPPAEPAVPAAQVPVGPDGEPPVEEVEVTDLLLVVDLTDEVLVLDEHPRYHLTGCPHLTGQAPIPLPLDEARSDGFTPCGTCRPDRQLADRARARRNASNS
jgi:hypothetical protein